MLQNLIQYHTSGAAHIFKNTAVAPFLSALGPSPHSWILD